MGAVGSKVQEAPRWDVRVGARRRKGVILNSFPLFFLAVVLQAQQGERNYAASQRGELRFSAFTVILP